MQGLYSPASFQCNVVQVTWVLAKSFLYNDLYLKKINVENRCIVSQKKQVSKTCLNL